MPAFAIAATLFKPLAVTMGRVLGIEHVAIAEYPGVIPNDSAALFEQKVRNDVVPGILTALDDVIQAATPSVEPEPGEIVCRGSLDDIQQYFTERLWSDGLPIIPPTRERIQSFLAQADREPSEVIGVLPAELREATVWSVAVNGVMAGCRPEHFPILLAIVEAIADPCFRLQDAGATPGWEPLVILSGPSAKTLNFNAQGGAMRAGRQANSSVGRFLRLFMRNVAGLRTPPGATDKACIGLNFNVALAENEDAVTGLGWKPFRVDRGFSADDDAVTVQSVVGISPHVYSGGSGAEQHLEPIARFMLGLCGPFAISGLRFRQSYPLLVMSPAVAQAFADDGWTKDDIRERLYDQLNVEADWLERYPLHSSGTELSLAELVRDEELPARYAQSDDPRRLVPMLLDPRSIGIVVAGDPARNQCRVYANNHEQGAPVSKKVHWYTRHAVL